ncbi:hypothetical protein ACFYXF_34705 [Streptomyces sp. NPDC002680]
MATLDPPSRRWLVVFNDEPYVMRIAAVLCPADAVTRAGDRP